MNKLIKLVAQSMLADSDMMVLTPSEFGCYMRLKLHYWVKGALPTGSLSLSKLAGCSVGQFQDVWPKVGRHFEDDGEGNLSCPSLDEARDKAKRTSERMSEVAYKRWRKVA